MSGPFTDEMRRDAKDRNLRLVHVEVDSSYTSLKSSALSVSFVAEEDDPDARAIARIALGKAGFKPEVPTDPMLDEKLLAVAREVGTSLYLYGPGSGRDLWNTLWDVMRAVDPDAAEYIGDHGKLPPHLRGEDDPDDEDE